jgi:hypothetical protein
MSNIDKLMQMATLEQLNIMVQQMSKPLHNEPNDVLSLPIVKKVIQAYEAEIKNKESSSSCTCKDYTSLLDNILNQVQSHNARCLRIENKLDELFSLIENKSYTELPVVIDKNQTKLYSFPGFFHSSNISEDIKKYNEDLVESYETTASSLETCLELHETCLESHETCLESHETCLESHETCLESHETCLEKENITLNIEETENKINDTNINLEILNEEDFIEDDAISEEEEAISEEEEAISEVKEEVVSEEEEEVVSEEEEAISQEEEETKEEEVVSEEEEEAKEEVVSEEEVGTEEEVTEDEEVFEIEIDDITYFATDEENGILYEVDKDGEVGKKVGIIKDGEPIFS